MPMPSRCLCSSQAKKVVFSGPAVNWSRRQQTAKLPAVIRIVARAGSHHKQEEDNSHDYVLAPHRDGAGSGITTINHEMLLPGDDVEAIV